MKKLIFMLVALLMTSGVMAQVKYSELSHDEAIVEAAKTGKTIILMGSATW